MKNNIGKEIRNHTEISEDYVLGGNGCKAKAEAKKELAAIGWTFDGMNGKSKARFGLQAKRIIGCHDFERKF